MPTSKVGMKVRQDKNFDDELQRFNDLVRKAQIRKISRKNAHFLPNTAKKKRKKYIGKRRQDRILKL